MKKSETSVQFSCETRREYLKNEWRRSRGKFLAYIANRYAWNTYPKKRKVAPFPLNVDIEVSSICQLKCTHCFRQYMDIGENQFMPLDLYRSIVTECGRHGLFTLKFSMRGELAQGIIGAGADWITMSFDGLGANYEAVRIPLKYEDSLNKLKILRRVRDEMGARTLLNVQGIWSSIKDDPAAYIHLMKSIVDRVAYNPDMHFDHNTSVPDPDFVCPRLWHRLCITSTGNYLKCPSDFTMQEILGNARDTGVKQAWDVLQEQQRTLHLSGRRLESKVCSVCHHGAKKKKVLIELGDEHREDFTYESKERN